jgi:drug/metabolite transporter, DME family
MPTQASGVTAPTLGGHLASSLQSLGRWQLVLAALLFSTGGAAIKACALSGWQIAGFRAALGAATLWLLLPDARKGWTMQTWIAGAAYAAMLVLFVGANKLTTAANAIFLQDTAPLYIVILAPLLLDERVRRSDLWFLAIMGTGLSLFFIGPEAPGETAPNPWLGNLLALGAGVAWALTIMGLRWQGAQKSETGHPAAAAAIAGNLLAFALCLPASFPIATVEAVDWMALVYLGVFQVGLAYVLVTHAVGEVPAFETSLILLIEPVFNPVWAWWMHSEVPSGCAVLGGGLIIGGIAARSLIEGRRQTKA